MSTTFPGAPKVLKGAIIGVDIFNPIASIVVFQYNPDTLSRSLEPKFADQGGDRTEALRLAGPPVETIDAEIAIDAIDQLERNEGPGPSQGIHPQLAALEMLIYPKSALTIANTVLLAIGTMEVIPPVAPLTLFIYGAKRVLPVKVTRLSVTEEAHDQALNPIRARAQVGMRVLSTADLSVTHPGYALFLAHQVVKEALAVVGSVGNLDAVAGGSVNLF
ncbi:MAG: hypothetical protein BGP12_11590 [Rhodospirillales bacterium 70-18]|mgnify:CR=1 FL=1|nr:hypothetical protein [Rhodospirillales bacterium]OJY68488.1 MAG: hypothetical protein BGP12_11590 [Rhodospirillales bacterium 70-18]